MIHVDNKQHGQLPVREERYLGHVAKGLQQHNNDDRQWAASYPNGELEKNFGHVANDLQQHVVISKKNEHLRALNASIVQIR